MQRQFSFHRWPAVLLALFLFVALGMAMPEAAQAERKITFANKMDVAVHFCLLYHDPSGGLRTHGWWKVEPGKPRQFKINCDNNYIFYYANGGKYVWRGNPEGDADSYLAYIVDSKFNTMTDLNEAPPGKNPRMVWFRKINAKNGTYNVTFKLKKK